MPLPFRDEHEAALILVERLRTEVADLREQVASLSDGRAENEGAFVARMQERAQQAERESATLRAEMESLRKRKVDPLEARALQAENRVLEIETESVTLRVETERLRQRNHELERQLEAKAALRPGPGETTGSFLDAVSRWFRRG